MRFFLLFTLFLFIHHKSFPQLFQIDNSVEVKELLQKYFIKKNHNGILIDKIRYKGLDYSKALFYYQGNQNVLPPYGLVLSTGNVIDVLGPNNKTASTESYLKGDNDLSKLYHNSKTFDAVVIEFDFISLTDSISFVFQFASDEYPEYVDKGVSDIFGFFVTNTKTNEQHNLSKLSTNGDPITIDLINSKSNNQYYVSNNSFETSYENTLSHFEYYENYKLFQFDGFTKPIYTGIKLEPFAKYHFKIALADVGDRRFDSWVFIKGNSFISNGNKIDLTDENINNFIDFNKLDSLTLNSEDNGYSIFVPVYFKYNSSALTQESKQYLNDLKELLYYSKNNLIIKGYTDESGSEVNNKILSQYRANQVMQYLIENGIEKERIKALGMGEIKKGELNIKSRKVEINILKKGSI